MVEPILDCPSFKEHYDEHRRILEANGCDVDGMINLRRKFHQHPEGGLKEFQTQKLLKETLLSFGIEESCIKVCAITGLVVDIHGTKEGAPGGVKSVALRADIDGLPIPENNPHLEYKSQTDHAHMCGHDGHMSTLLSAAAVLAKKRPQIPKGQFVRLLLQPAEEGPGGALPMVKEGCLEGIDEVYGYHNIPQFPEG